MNKYKFPLHFKNLLIQFLVIIPTTVCFVQLHTYKITINYNKSSWLPISMTTLLGTTLSQLPTHMKLLLSSVVSSERMLILPLWITSLRGSFVTKPSFLVSKTWMTLSKMSSSLLFSFGACCQRFIESLSETSTSGQSLSGLDSGLLDDVALSRLGDVISALIGGGLGLDVGQAIVTPWSGSGDQQLSDSQHPITTVTSPISSASMMYTSAFPTKKIVLINIATICIFNAFFNVSLYSFCFWLVK